MMRSLLLLALAATTAAAPALSKMGACASVAPGEDLTAAGVKYRCEPSADHCGQEFASTYTGPETGTEANFHTHEMLEAHSISCECAFTNVDHAGGDTHHALESTCYGVGGGHGSVTCMGDANCALVSGTSLKMGYESGTYTDTDPCTCYSGGNKGTAVGEYTQYGACFDTSTATGMCVRVKEDCGTLDDSNVYYAPGSDELMSVKMFCPCYETYTGYCYKGHGQGGYCATSAEVCTDGHTYVDAKTAKTYDMDACMLCLEDDANDGPLPLPAYYVPATPAPSPKPTLKVGVMPETEKADTAHRVAGLGGLAAMLLLVL
jgi:hypothetical protein